MNLNTRTVCLALTPDQLDVLDYRSEDPKVDEVMNRLRSRQKRSFTFFESGTTPVSLALVLDELHALDYGDRNNMQANPGVTGGMITLIKPLFPENPMDSPYEHPYDD